MVTCRVCNGTLDWADDQNKWVHHLVFITSHEAEPREEQEPAQPKGSPVLRCAKCAEPAKSVEGTYVHDYVAVGEKLLCTRGVTEDQVKARIRGCSQKSAIEAVAGTYDWEGSKVNRVVAINSALVFYFRDWLEANPGLNWVDVRDHYYWPREA